MEEVKNEFPVSCLSLSLFFKMILPVGRELSDLPCLSLILSEILHHEGLNARNGQQTLAGCVNRKATQITGKPTPAKLANGGRDLGNSLYCLHNSRYSGIPPR